MKIIRNDIEVFDILEKANVADFDPAKLLVLDFIYKETWHLLLFNPTGELKGCCLFLISEKDLTIEAEKLLIPELLALDDKHGYDLLKTKALEIVEYVLRDKKSTGLYFDSH
ncbi:MAG: hypothetical protein M3R17_13515 [Bacteroidota bacterium]|nr:hypothetical protein [Bacteroidota bacterium]